MKFINAKSSTPENAPNTIVRNTIRFVTKGPHSGWMMLSTIDQASGLSFGILYKAKSRSDNKDNLRQEIDKVMSDLVDQVASMYEKPGKYKRVCPSARIFQKVTS